MFRRWMFVLAAVFALMLGNSALKEFRYHEATDKGYQSSEWRLRNNAHGATFVVLLVFGGFAIGRFVFKGKWLS